MIFHSYASLPKGRIWMKRETNKEIEPPNNMGTCLKTLNLVARANFEGWPLLPRMYLKMAGCLRNGSTKWLEKWLVIVDAPSRNCFLDQKPSPMAASPLVWCRVFWFVFPPRHPAWQCWASIAGRCWPGTDWLEAPTMYQAYFSGLWKWIFPQHMAWNMLLTYLQFRIWNSQKDPVIETLHRWVDGKSSSMASGKLWP